MKTTTIKIVLPDWARWIATDEDGRIYIYEKKPIPKASMWISQDSSDSDLLCHSLPPKDFAKTLRRVK